MNTPHEANRRADAFLRALDEPPAIAAQALRDEICRVRVVSYVDPGDGTRG